MRKKVLAIFLTLFSALSMKAQDPADFVLPSIISDHAVMLRNANVKLWGWCPSVWDLKIVCSWSPNDTIHVSSNKYNYWETFVKTPKEEGPYNIKFYGWENKLFKQVDDILMGEPWLCSGQSNMEYCFKWRIDDLKDRTNLFDNKKIRVFRVNKASSAYPVERIEGKWQLCTPEVMDDFSVVGFFFGKYLNQGLNDVPVGLIGSYWGGTAIEPWIDDFTFNHENLVEKSKKLEASWAPTANSSLFNAMIYPIKNYTISGVVWYQGEANNERYSDYKDMFSGLIRGWRNVFHTYLPFYFVQIAPYNGYASKNGAYLREQQAEVAATVKNTGMVVIGDLVNDISDVHPSLKREVGERLANMALCKTYGKCDFDPCSPEFKSYKIKGNSIIVSTTSKSKLRSSGKVVKNFEILSADGVLYPAEAKILENGEIQVKAKGVKKPVGVRYCFSNDAEPNLFNNNGLPLAPFRTDKEK